eukprot:CAMPEP_0176000152 /NCGR_PEP_ID=MMETSP0108-20121206/57665_1 /TAXON_ID=195067 ORGANISM="Goniomonas pacifica, Strain CCMP1869" /NCGR_SAMPLE_ID=MMETSP0108 /ASSEMBLY_ACC=CAM_ASM_000204 /LENGTH=174 /DNA_ID=CAMNT_0017332627 /DNA_START=1 /DNA_END=526 /DNA_ORIENTATION=+
MAIWATRAFFAVPVAVAFGDLVATVKTVEQEDMAPYLEKDDKVLVLRPKALRYKQHEAILRSFDDQTILNLTVLRRPDDHHFTSFRRVVALEGDWIRNRQQFVKLVPQGHAWLEADGQRTNVMEQEEVASGHVPIGLLEGHVACVLWPPNRFGTVPAHTPPGRLVRECQPGDWE